MVCRTYRSRIHTKFPPLFLLQRTTLYAVGHGFHCRLQLRPHCQVFLCDETVEGLDIPIQVLRFTRVPLRHARPSLVTRGLQGFDLRILGSRSLSVVWIHSPFHLTFFEEVIRNMYAYGIHALKVPWISRPRRRRKDPPLLRLSRGVDGMSRLDPSSSAEPSGSNATLPSGVQEEART